MIDEPVPGELVGWRVDGKVILCAVWGHGGIPGSRDEVFSLRVLSDGQMIPRVTRDKIDFRMRGKVSMPPPGDLRASNGSSEYRAKDPIQRGE